MAAVLKWRPQGQRQWHETAMSPLGNDRWTATCAFHQVGLGEFTIEAYTERWLSWRHEWQKKFDAGVRPLTTEIEEAALQLEGAAHRAKKLPADAARLRELAAQFRAGTPEEVHALAALPELAALMAAFPDRSDAHEMKPAHPVRVDRPAARFAAWYEFFPRSAEGHGDRGSTFRDCLPRIDDAKAMGFDVIYFPPIHPRSAWRTERAATTPSPASRASQAAPTPSAPRTAAISPSPPNSARCATSSGS